LRYKCRKASGPGIAAGWLILAACLNLPAERAAQTARYPIVDTNQTACYDSEAVIEAPAPGQPFYGQDAQFAANAPRYVLGTDGKTVSDLNTGLTWQQGYESDKNWTEAKAVPDDLNAAEYGGYTGWRLPTIKELYSIWDGRRGWPHLDTGFFARDPQASPHGIFWSVTKYAGLLESTLEDAAGSEMAFGVNFDTGHIKAYTTDTGPTHFVRCVRGARYGANDFLANGDGTITDRATGLMWAQTDSGAGLDWEHVLAYVQARNADGYLGYKDWRMPNTKELQSLVDYTRSPNATDATKAGPAIDPLFLCTGLINEAGAADYPYYWTGTTVMPESGGLYTSAWYVAFGRAVDASGYDLHGAGAVRFDLKVAGGPARQDAERVFNFVRLVRGDGVPPVEVSRKGGIRNR
jgi:hypothetical protein